MKKNLSGTLFALAAAFLTSSMAMATTTCPTAPYSSYTGASFSCATNNLTFSNFTFSSAAQGGALIPAAGGVGVVPQEGVGNEGFLFTVGFFEGPGEFQDATLSFLVTAAPGTMIDDLYIFFNGSSSGTGTTDFTETYCANSFTSGCHSFFVTGTADQHIDIAPTTKLYITKDFGASGGTDGRANISKVQNNYSNTSAVPEPASLSMMGLGLLGLGLIGRRRKV